MDDLGRMALETGALCVYGVMTLFFFALAFRLFDMALLLSGGRRGVQTVLAFGGIVSGTIGVGLLSPPLSALFVHLSGFPS